MRRLSVALALLLILGGLSYQAFAKKKEAASTIYIFGFAASFTDTIVHFTPIQQLDSVAFLPKYGFLRDRNEYSYQLRNYLDQKQQMPNRTCVVFYNSNKEKLEKKYAKMKKLYTKAKDGKQHFDIRFINDDEFHFNAVKEMVVETATEESADEEKVPDEKKKKHRGKKK